MAGLKIGDPVDARIPWVRKIHDLDEAWGMSTAGARCEALRQRGAMVGDALREGAKVGGVVTLPLTTLLYPTTFAFNRAVPLPNPYVVMTHRTLLVQVETDEGRKNILFNPTDIDASRKTPFFAKLEERFGTAMVERIVTRYGTIEEQLARVGVRREDIDVVAYDHFHTQDIRRTLGSDIAANDGSLYQASFPHALLLAPGLEWDDWGDLHPMQKSWFVKDGARGVPSERIVRTENDLLLGPGCLLLRTPGHTVGNQTLFVHTDGGVFGCSENGCSADNWTPHESRIPGVRAQARFYEADVVLNANTPEHGGDQYLSMVLEKSVVDPAPQAPAMVQMFPSSEVTPSLLSPGVKPSLVFGEMSGGVIVRS